MGRHFPLLTAMNQVELHHYNIAGKVLLPLITGLQAVFVGFLCIYSGQLLESKSLMN